MRRLAQVGSIVALVAYFLLLSSLLSYFLILRKDKETVKKNIAVYEQRIKSLEPVESKQVFLKEKLKELTQILKFEEKPEAALKDLRSLSIPGVTFSDISYSDGSLSLGGQAEDALVLDAVVKHLESQGSDLFAEARIEGLSKLKETGYSFGLSLIR